MTIHNRKKQHTIVTNQSLFFFGGGGMANCSTRTNSCIDKFQSSFEMESPKFVGEL